MKSSRFGFEVNHPVARSVDSLPSTNFVSRFVPRQGYKHIISEQSIEITTLKNFTAKNMILVQAFNS